MTKSKEEMILALCAQIGARLKLIVEIWPKSEDESKLRDLAAASIHVALFTGLLCEVKAGYSETWKLRLNEFLENCGCKDRGFDV